MAERVRTIHSTIKRIHAERWRSINDNIVWIEDNAHQQVDQLGSKANHQAV